MTKHQAPHPAGARRRATQSVSRNRLLRPDPGRFCLSVWLLSMNHHAALSQGGGVDQSNDRTQRTRLAPSMAPA